jgi:hypothetical protein
MPVPQRRQAERTVLLRVFLVADADHRRLEQSHDGGHDLAPGEPAPRQVAIDLSSQSRQAAGELDRALVLVLVAHLPPVGVVAVLEPPARVAPRGLDVPVGARADPDVLPGRGYRE